MATVADYRVIRDGGLTIQTGGDIDKEVNFSLPTNARLDQSMVLQFFFVSQSNATNLSYRSSFNGTSIRTINVNGNHFATLHEALGGNNLVHGQNTYKVEIVGGTGGVTVSDVVLWYQANS